MNGKENLKETIKKDIVRGLQLENKTWKRFNHNQCWSTRYFLNSDTQNFYKLIRSYDTIVAILYDSHYIELGKWSRTTSTHVNQFYRQEVPVGVKKIFIDLKDFCDRL